MAWNRGFIWLLGGLLVRVRAYELPYNTDGTLKDGLAILTPRIHAPSIRLPWVVKTITHDEPSSR